MKEQLLAYPERYAWNCVLESIQFTQVELLQVRQHIPMRPMILFQECITLEFLKENFSEDIDNDLTVDWNLVKTVICSRDERKDATQER
jgi:hypothetical protein